MVMFDYDLLCVKQDEKENPVQCSLIISFQTA